MLEAALAAGVAAAGGHALLGGVLPTPGAALLVRRYGFDLAAVVSASHNPYEDNGIKFFGPEGTKLDDDQESGDRARARGDRRGPRPIGRVRELHGAAGDYLRELEPRFARPRPDGVKVLLDCAQRRHLPRRARDLPPPRRDRRGVAAEPDGRNINDGCGSTHVERARRAGHRRRPRHRLRLRRRRRPRAGGRPQRRGRGRRRADRPRRAAPARRRPAPRRRRGRDRDDQLRLPPGDGAGRASRSRPPPVGDRHVLAELLRARLGARRRAVGPHHRHRLRARPATASRPRCSRSRRSTASDLADRHAMRKLPQRLVNVRVADRERADGADEVWAAVERGAPALEGRGRVLVRPSGTEPLVRVMVEAPDEDECEAMRSARRLVESAGAEHPSGASKGPEPLTALVSKSHVRNRRIRRAARLPRAPARGPEKLEYRGYDSAGRLAARRRRRSTRVRAVGNLSHLREAVAAEANAATATRLDRHRPHALGHARPRDRGERPPALRHLRPRAHRAQRHRRELDRPARAACRPTAPSSPPRPTPRSSPT